MDFVLELKKASKIFGSGDTSVVAMDEIDLQVSKGEIVLIMGPSGSGKTTLLSIAGGLLKPTSGRVIIAGREITKLSEKELPLIRLEHIGFVFQSFNLLSALTALENVRLVLDLAGRDKIEATKIAKELLIKEGLEDKINNLPKELSGGQAQRVSIARALVNNPNIILADEPTANLDSKTGHQAMMLIRELAKEKDKAVVIVTHDQRVIDIADRVLWLEDGKITNQPKSEKMLKVDPVCRLPVDPKEADFLSEYKKQKFYFCSQKCKNKFDKKPQTYGA